MKVIVKYFSPFLLSLLILFVVSPLLTIVHADVSITEFPVPISSSVSNNFLQYITSGPDGNLWFTEINDNQVGRITSSGTITEYTLPSSSSNPEHITSGPDGNLWFTEPGSNHIGSITTSGTITEFSIPTTLSNASGITTGPDGNLWFTEANFNKIGRITPSGTITEFSTSSRPAGITVGPDGNLWYASFNDNKIGHISTTGGSVTEFSVPTSNSAPLNITTGSDGNLWFTEYLGNKIGKITPGGTITEYSVPTSNSIPYDITTGSDGKVWFTEDSADKFGEIATDGAITEFSVPTTNSGLVGITPDANNNLWIIESLVDKIAKVDLSSITATPTPTPTPTATPTPTPTPLVNFELNRDGYQFSNFNFVQTLPSSTTPWKLFDTQLNAILQDNDPVGIFGVLHGVIAPYLYNNYQPQGLCYGFTATSILYFENASLKPVNKNTYDFTTSDASNNIIDYQQQQYLPALQAFVNNYDQSFNFAQQYSDLVNLLQNQHKPAMLNISSTGQKIGHSIVAYNIIDNGNTKTVQVYDNNHPYDPSNPSDSARTATFNLATNTFNYTDGSSVYNNVTVSEALPNTPTNASQIINSAFYTVLNLLRTNNFIQIHLHSPVTGLLTDQNGNRFGYVNGNFVNEISNAQIYHLDDETVFYVPSTSQYTLTTTGTSDATAGATLGIDITTPTSGTQTKWIDYTHIPVSPGSTTTQTVGSSNTDNTITLSAGGSKNPDEVATMDDSSQTTYLPTTSLSFSPTASSDGTFSDPETITLSASVSSGLTIAHTYYTVDGGSQQTYSSPFTVTGNGSHTIIYWSVDSNGNQEAQNTKTFTIHSSYNLTGKVYIDANQNGVQDSGETGYNGATVSLNTGQTATSDSSGNYSFPTLLSGTYTVTLTVPSGYTATTTNPASVPLASNTTQNFGIAPTPTATPTPTTTTATAGYTTTNGSFDSGNIGMLSSTQITTASVSGKSQSISVYIGSVGASPHNHIQVGIYSDNGSNAPGTLLGESVIQTLTANSWNTITIPDVAISANTKYFLTFNVDSSTTQYAFNSQTTGLSKWKGSTNFGVWPNSYGTPSDTESTRYAIYLTYINASASPTPTPGTVTAGYTTTNGSFDTGNNNEVSATQIRTGAVGGTAQSIHVYIGSVTASPHNHMQVGIYSDNGSDKPGTLLGSSTSQTLTANSWNTIPLTGVTISPNTKYFLTFNVDGSTTHYGWSNNAAGASYWQNTTFGTWPSSFGTPIFSANQQYAIYLTY